MLVLKKTKNLKGENFSSWICGVVMYWMHVYVHVCTLVPSTGMRDAEDQDRHPYPSFCTSIVSKELHFGTVHGL